MTDLIQTEPDSNSICSVILNRPDRRNALSIEMLKQLNATLCQLETAPECRVVVLRATGNVFSAGLELQEAVDPDRTAESARCLAECMRTIQLSSLVVVAAVQGGAHAGGAALVASCDIVIADTNAELVFPAARRGLLPSLILDVIRSRVRDGDLRDLFLTGLPANAATAQRMGLIQRVVAPGELLAEAGRVARAVTEGAPETIRQTKAMIRGINSPHSTSDTAFANSIAGHLEGQNSDEAREGIASFLEKRDPFWKEQSGP